MTARSSRGAALLGLMLSLAVLTACGKGPKGHWSDNDPDVRLDWLLSLYETALANGSTCHEVGGSVTRDCDRVVREVERLTVEFPHHERALMASALMTYERGERARAQAYLDRLLARREVHPESVVLRSRIALDDGNLPFARDLVERHIRLAPDHAGLREALAASLYLARDYEGALMALRMASQLGAPLWRVDYHSGIIAEASGDRDGAFLHYRECLNNNPGYRPAAARLVALEAADGLERTQPFR